MKATNRVKKKANTRKRMRHVCVHHQSIHTHAVQLEAEAENTRT